MVAEVRFLVVARDERNGDDLLGIVPPGAPAQLVLLGMSAEDVSDSARTLPVDHVVVVPQAHAASEPAVVGEMLRDLVAEVDVVVLDSAQAGRDLAGWLCATLDLPLVWAIDALRLHECGGIEADRVVLGGSHRLVHRLPTTAVVMAKPLQGASRQGRQRAQLADVVVHGAQGPVSRVHVLESGESHTAGVPLAGARIVVSVGRGIGGPERVDAFRELAGRVGAALGASRVVVDAGWLPFAHQVGQTGTAVAADLYVAFGISGAIQHLAGMRASRQVVAVNIDKDAPLCRLADLVVEADANDVAEALLERLADRRACAVPTGG